MILKQTFKNHLSVSNFTLVSTLLFFAGWWYFNFDNGYFLSVGFIYLVYTIPALFLHISYTIKNYGEEIEITPNEIIVRTKKKEWRYDKSELARIDIYKPASLDKGGIGFTSVEYYYFARITTKTGEEIIITCLMTSHIENSLKQLEGVPWERHKRNWFWNSQQKVDKNSKGTGG